MDNRFRAPLFPFLCCVAHRALWVAVLAAGVSSFSSNVTDDSTAMLGQLPGAGVSGLADGQRPEGSTGPSARREERRSSVGQVGVGLLASQAQYQLIVYCCCEAGEFSYKGGEDSVDDGFRLGE